MMFVKENVHDFGFYVDKEDNSVVRSDKLFESLFERAGFTVVKHIYQLGFPKDLYKISLYALYVAQ
jgi:protein N-terminal methyltransferase